MAGSGQTNWFVQHRIISFCLINPESTAEIFTSFSADQQSGVGGCGLKGNKVLTHTQDGSALHYQASLTTKASK
ncbi:hypothetical protein AB669_04125 [Pedobacter sp. BMA]|nr:hypothetical protein AB669_04125 [Pedobacter sp. BMA]